MPITINDCSKCKILPEVYFHTLDGLMGIYEICLECPKCHKYIAIGMTLEEVAESWNETVDNKAEVKYREE